MALAGAASETGAGAFISDSATTPTTLVTASGGAGKIVRIEKLLITNHDTSNNVTLDLYKIPSGGSVSANDYKFVLGLNIAPSNGNGGVEDIREVAGMILENGDSLRARAGTASKLKFDISYWVES